MRKNNNGENVLTNDELSLLLKSVFKRGASSYEEHNGDWSIINKDKEEIISTIISVMDVEVIII